jgi:hypothetical protein
MGHLKPVSFRTNLARLELDNFKKRRPYERLCTKTELLIARLEPIVDLVMVDSNRKYVEIISLVRKYFECTINGPLKELKDSYDCDMYKFSKKDSQLLDRDIMVIFTCIREAAGPIRSLNQLDNSNSLIIVEKIKKAIDASERIRILSLKRLDQLV